MRDFRTVRAWQQAYHLVPPIYVATRDFPDEERYGLMVRIRRTAADIQYHIARGCGYQFDDDFARLLTHAMGLACGLEADLLLARELGFLNDLAYEPLVAELIDVKKMLAGLIKALTGDR